MQSRHDNKLAMNSSSTRHETPKPTTTNMYVVLYRNGSLSCIYFSLLKAVSVAAECGGKVYVLSEFQ